MASLTLQIQSRVFQTPYIRPRLPPAHAVAPPALMPMAVSMAAAAMELVAAALAHVDVQHAQISMVAVAQEAACQLVIVVVSMEANRFIARTVLVVTAMALAIAPAPATYANVPRQTNVITTKLFARTNRTRIPVPVAAQSCLMLVQTKATALEMTGVSASVAEVIAWEFIV